MMQGLLQGHLALFGRDLLPGYLTDESRRRTDATVRQHL
jgi:hypothetical protein